jgi:hypothetical protein
MTRRKADEPRSQDMKRPLAKWRDIYRGAVVKTYTRAL